MWACPKCGSRFFNTNQSHSCGRYTVGGFLRGKSDTAVRLFDFFLSEYKKIGDFELHPVKTRVALLTKMRFCSINEVGDDFIDVHLVLTEPHSDKKCFYRIDNLANRFYVHHIKIHKTSDITPAVRRCMKLAYAVGQRKHVKAGKA